MSVKVRFASVEPVAAGAVQEDDLLAGRADHHQLQIGRVVVREGDVDPQAGDLRLPRDLQRGGTAVPTAGIARSSSTTRVYPVSPR